MQVVNPKSEMSVGEVSFSGKEDLEKKDKNEKSPKTCIDFEIVLKYIGDLGRYQIILVLMAYWVCIPTGMMQVAAVFLAAVPDHRCWIPPYDDYVAATGNGTQYEDQVMNATIPQDDGEYESCSRYNYTYSDCTNGSLDCLNTTEYITTESCIDGYVYDDSVYESTVTTEWDLVCDRLILGTSVTSLFYLGVLFSALIGGNIADIIGRVPTMLISELGVVAVGIACAFSPTLLAFALLRFGIALFLMAGYVACFVYVMEITGEKWRTFVGVNVQAAFAIGYMILSGLAYVWRDWRELQLVISLFPLPFVIFYFLLPESPRWLFTKNKDEKAKSISQMMARRNGTTLPDDVWEQATVEQPEEEDETKSPIELFRRPRMRIVTINIMFQWFVVSLVYYGLSLNVGNLAGDDYVNNTLSGLVELISFPIIILTIDRFGRRPILFWSFVIGGLACLASTACNTLADGDEALLTASTVLALTGKMAVSGAFALIYNYTAELYPTNVRSTGVGVGSMSARLGSVLTPYTILLQYIIPWLTGTVFGTMSLFAAAACLFLPETMGLPLLSTLDEAEEFYEHPKSFIAQKQREAEEEKLKELEERPDADGGFVNSSYL